MNRPTIYDYKDYRSFLAAAIEHERGLRKGAQARLAERIGCQSSYISMVMAERTELSLEQAAAAAEFFAMTPGEQHLLLLLVQKARAGTQRLRQYFANQAEAVQQERSNLATRLEYQQVLNEEQRAQYYSAWYYAAIHIGLTVPRLQSADALAAYLQLPIATVQQALDFLVQTGLAARNEGRIEVGPTRLHTSRESPFLNQSHINWRLQTLIALQRPDPEHFHYSSIVSMSASDVSRLRETMIRAIEDIRAAVKESPEEDLVVYSMDCFTLGPTPES